jgi:hypothetical protein
MPCSRTRSAWLLWLTSKGAQRTRAETETFRGCAIKWREVVIERGTLLPDEGLQLLCHGMRWHWLIGTTRPRVNFFMNKFRKLGFVEYNGTLKVHNSLLNIVLHD